MIVTVMSDASFCSRTKSAGYGIWIKSNRGQYHRGGNFKERPRTPSEAEAMALSIAVFFAFHHKLAIEGDKLILQTDCLYNIHAYRGGYRKKRSELTVKTVDYTKRLIEDNSCTYEIRHVRAHRPEEGKRNYINEVCDTLAKTAMRRQRKNGKDKI